MAYKYEFGTPPWEHQRAAIRRAWGRVGFAYLMEMRTGKSKTLIDEFCALYETGKVDGVLLLAPKGVYRNWTKVSEDDPRADGEIHQHMPARIWERCRIAEWYAGGGTAANQRRLLEILEPGDELRILAMNSEALSSGTRGYDFAVRFLKSCASAMLAVDETVDFADPSSNRTRKLIGYGRPGTPKHVPALRDMARYRRIMNGLLSPRGPLQVWSQFEILEPACLGYRSFYAFKSRYAVTKKQVFGGRRVDVVVGYRDEEDLHRRVAQHSFRVRKDQCWDLPKKQYLPRDVELTAEQRRMYDDVREFAMAEISAGGPVVSATVVIAQIIRLHQLVCGFVVDEQGRTHDVPSARMDELLRVVDQTEDKVVVWAKYHHSLNAIVAALRERYGPASTVRFWGEVPLAEREDAKVRLQTDPACRFLVGNPEAGGRGIKLTAARTMVYYCNGYSLDKRAQSEERCEGAEQTTPLACVDLIARGTVDEKIISALRRNIDLSSAVMGDGYREWLI